MARSSKSQRRLLREASDWWDNDRNRLLVIRTTAYVLFAVSIAGTVYAGVNGDLPPWAMSLYVAFAIQLVFMTFMYAIRHSGEQELTRKIYTLRTHRVGQWVSERELLAELVRYAACSSAGVDPLQPALGSNQATRRSRKQKTPWPNVNAAEVVCASIREAVEHQLSSPSAGTAGNREPIRIDFVAYSAETLISLSREILVELEEIRDEKKTLEIPVAVRILVRDTGEDSTWLVPLARDEARDIEYFDELRVRFRNVQFSALGEFEDGLAGILTPRNVDFTVRGYELEPFIKGLQVQRSGGVIGFYTVDELRNPEGWDYSGHGVPLCSMKSNGSYFEDLSASVFKRWFDEVWDDRTLCRNLDF